MNIREIEQQLGIPRANVRYYEKEGLLHPARGENNYRNYSDEDIETLKKIKLLRQLDMPVDTIRSVQTGAVTLEDALSRQSQLLASESAKLEQSQTICRSMLDDQVTYAQLQPAKYENLPALTGQQQSRPTPWEPPRPPMEGAVWAYSPWQRYWARAFDLGLAGLVVTVLLSFIFHVSSVTNDGIMFNWVTSILTWLIVFALEPLLLSRWGTTPGKWLLGLELRDSWGNKLNYSDGLLRTWRVLGYVYGYHIPFYTWYRNYKAYKTCRDNAEMEYDAWEGNLYYSRVGDRWIFRAVVSVLITLILFVPIDLWSSYQVYAPPNGGDLTPTEFWENERYIARRMGMGSVPDFYTLTTDANGYVTAVTLRHEGDGVDVLPFPRITIAAMCLQDRVSPLQPFPFANLLSEGNLYDLIKTGEISDWENGMTMTLTLEQEGYTAVWTDGPRPGGGFGYLITDDNYDGMAHFVFTMRLEK